MAGQVHAVITKIEWRPFRAADDPGGANPPDRALLQVTAVVVGWVDDLGGGLVVEIPVIIRPERAVEYIVGREIMVAIVGGNLACETKDAG